MPVLRLALWLTVALLAPRAASAQVQGCDDDADEVEGDFEVTPQDGARGVARNAPIIVRYSSDVDLAALRAMLESERQAEEPVPCAGELVCVLETDSDEAPRVIAMQVEIDGNLVRLTPREPLAASTEHAVLVVQPDLDIVARDQSSFHTGTRTDREAPVLDYDADDVSVSIATLPPECAAPEGTRRVVLELPPATDDGDASSVTLEVVLLGDDGEDDVRARVRNEGDPVLVSFLLTPAETGRRICLQVRARDALGHAAEGEPRLCFNPSTRPLFSSACAAGLVARDKSGGAWAWLCLLAALAWRRRRSPIGAVPAKGL